MGGWVDGWRSLRSLESKGSKVILFLGGEEEEEEGWD